jgi:hypothetical protein
MENIGNFTNNAVSSAKDASQKVFNNPIVYGVLAIFLAIYGPRLQPRLPKIVRDLFNHSVFRFFVILLILFISSKDLQLSLIITIAFLLILSLVNSLDVQEHFDSKCSKREHFTSDGEDESDEPISETFDDDESIDEDLKKCGKICSKVKEGDKQYDWCKSHNFISEKKKDVKDSSVKQPVASDPKVETFQNYDEDADQMETYENFLKKTMESYKFEF